ncbi:MAG: shikimate kinase [Firmicutes bacterium]|nr:shikimate kinase [Bacillota bacterium]
MNNIILIGMPGVGKTTVGRKLANQSNKPFLDLDEEYCRIYNMSIEETFFSLGEKIFRKREKNTIESLTMSGITNTIVACGGGVVENEDNMHCLKKLGKVVFLDCDIDTLISRMKTTSQKAVFKNYSLEELYQRRIALYKKHANITIDTRGKEIKETVDLIINL